MNEEQARQFLRALFKLVWEPRDKSKIPTFYAASLSGFVGQVPLNIKSVYEAVDYLAMNMASSEYSVHDMVVSDNKIAAVVNVKSITMDRTKERYTSIAYFFELQKGKINKLRMYYSMPQITELEPEEGESEPKSFFHKAKDEGDKSAREPAKEGAETQPADHEVIAGFSTAQPKVNFKSSNISFGATPDDKGEK